MAPPTSSCGSRATADGDAPPRASAVGLSSAPARFIVLASAVSASGSWIVKPVHCRTVRHMPGAGIEPAPGISNGVDPGVRANPESLSVSYEISFYHAGADRIEDARAPPNFAERRERADARESSMTLGKTGSPRAPASRSP